MRTLDEVMGEISGYCAGDAHASEIFYELTQHVGALIDKSDPAGAATMRDITVESGHVSLEVGTTAKGEYTYSAKVVMPFFPDAIGNVNGVEAERAREIAQENIASAETFLRTRYGRKDVTP